MPDALFVFLLLIGSYVGFEVAIEAWVRFRARKTHWVAVFESSQGETAYVRGYGRRRLGRTLEQKLMNPDTGSTVPLRYATYAISAIRRSDWQFVRFEPYSGQPCLSPAQKGATLEDFPHSDAV